MYINMIMSFVTDDWMNFIVFVLPEEVKVYTLSRGKSELVKTCEQKYEILVGLSHICLGNILVKNVYLCGQGKLRSTVHGPYRMERNNSFTEKMHGRLITIDRWSSMIDRTQGIYEGKIDMAS